MTNSISIIEGYPLCFCIAEILPYSHKKARIPSKASASHSCFFVAIRFFAIKQKHERKGAY